MGFRKQGWIAACALACGLCDTSFGVSREAGALDAAAASQRVVVEVNAFREQQGRTALRSNPQLAAAARDFAAYMARTGRFSHEADGREPADRAREHGYAYCIVDENIGYEQRSSGFTSDELAEQLVGGWKGSPPHRHNMLDPDVAETGVAVAHDARTGRWYGVQMFGAPASTRSVFELTNASGATVRYRLGDQGFELAPRVTRTHEECRPREIVLDGAGKAAFSSIRPRNGDRYRIVRDKSGSLGLERE